MMYAFCFRRKREMFEKTYVRKECKKMKTSLKRMAAMLLVVVMSVYLSITAFAAQGDVVPKGSLTVTGDQLGGKTVTAVRMFTVRATEGGTTGSYTYDSYTLEDAWLEFFKATEAEGGIGKDALEAIDGVTFSDTATDDEYRAAAIAYVNSLQDNNGAGTLAGFAHKAQKWYRAHAAEFATLMTQRTATQDEGTITGTATFTGLTTGYYLVFPEGGSTGDDNRATDAMLINIPTDEPNATWNIKSTYPTIDKTVVTVVDETESFTDTDSAQVGDTVTFKLKSTVPDMTDYETYVFKFVDTMSDGLTFVQAGGTVANTDVTVTIGGQAVTSGYTVTLEGQKLTVAFADLKTVVGATTGAEIAVTYQATINENAVTLDSVTNTAHVEYSNDPKGTGTGSSTPDQTDIYTYDIKVHKYTGTWGENAPVLKGATFVLSKDAKLNTDTNGAYTNAISLVGSKNSYRIAKTGETSTVTSFTTTDTGVITIDGLEAGTYYLHEVEAPAGYNKLTAPVEIVIDVTSEGASYTTPIYTISGEANDNAGDSTVAVQNNSGTMLPETGSIGTIGLTALGIGVVLAGIFLPRRKKSNNQG